MDRHTVTKENIQVTLRNIGVELYAIEEALLHADKTLPALERMGRCLRELQAEIDGLDLGVEIRFDKPTPAHTMLVRSSDIQPVRKNMCKGP